MQNKVMPSWFLIVLLIYSCSQWVLAVERDPDEFFFDSSFGDLQEELENAKEEGKKGIILFFELTECPFCHWMKTHVLNQQAVQDYFKKYFTIIKIDIEGDVELTDFQGNITTQKAFSFKHRVRATPVFGFFNLQGKPIFRYTGKTKNMQEFMWMGEYIVSKAYKKQPFRLFKKAKQS